MTMMSAYERLSSIVSRITYKPGWELRVIPPHEFDPSHLQPERWRTFILQGTMTQPSIDNPKVEIQLSQQISVFSDALERLDDAQIVDCFIINLIRAMELHEMKEWLKFDGVCVQEPHAEKVR